jgi:hypothetical protein
MGLNPYGVVVEHDPDTGERRWRARVSRSIPDTWSIVIGDVIHNLRAALDYLAWELWVKEGGKVTEPAATGIVFWVIDPTKPSNPKVAKAVREGKVGAFGNAAVTLMERLQVDPGRKASPDPELRPLWLLHQLDIWDKHRRLNVVGGTEQLTHMTLGGPGEDVHIEEMVIGGGDIRTVPIADGTELLRLTLGPTTPDVQMQQQFTGFVAFEQEGPGKGEPVIPTLDQLISFVDEALTLFAPLLM